MRTPSKAQMRAKAGLPAIGSTLVGRDRELRELAALEHRWLITLTGPAGVGKTRLALMVAERYGARSTTFVDLTGARDEADVVALALAAHGLEVPERADVSVGRKRLATILQRAGGLLVLDNAEHVVEAVAGLVVECHSPKARFIVTSRQPLSVAGEARYDVSPLTQDEAVHLFEQRATSLGSNFVHSDVERLAIREVVARLEGVPLAIELAAARTTVLPPSEIARHIGRSLDILKGGARDAPTRHSSLHAAIEWSFRLLEPHEQRSLAACSVFDDGFTASAADAIIHRPPGVSIVDLLQSFCEKSLGRADPDPRAGGKARYRLYESVRSFAAAELAQSPERADVVARHAAYFAVSMSRIEMGNVVAAIRSLDATDPRACARMTIDAAPMLATYYPVDARIALLRRAVDAAERSNETLLISRALCARGHALLLAACIDEAEADGVRAASLAMAEGAADDAAATEILLARIAVDRLKLDEAIGHASRANELAGPPHRARALYVLGWIQTQRGDPGASKSLATAFAEAQAARDTSTEGMILTAMAEHAHVAGRLREAVELHTQALALARSHSNQALEALAAANRFYALAEIPDFDEAARQALEAIAVARTLGDARLEVLSLAGLGFVRQGQGRLDEALEATSSALALPSGDYATIVARICHGAVLAERGSITLAQATFDALSTALSGLEAHPVHRLLELARLFCDLGLAIECAGRDERAASSAHIERIRRVLAASIAARPIEHPDVRIWRVFWEKALVRHVGLSDLACRVEVDSRGRWFRRDAGSPIACGSKPVLRRLLVTLARARVATPGRTVRMAELIAGSWPGQKMLESSARRRLQVAISRLRELGLVGIIVNEHDGYLLAPAADVVLVESD